MRYTRENYIKWAAYGILLLVVFLIQTSYRFQFSLFGIRPDLIPFYIAAIALFEGPACAGTTGFFAGLLCDFTRSGIDGFFPFYYVCFGVLAGLAAEKYFRKNILSGLVIGSFLSVFRNLCEYVFYYGLILRAPFLIGMRITFTELIASFFLSPLVYFSVSLINRHFAEEED